MDHLDEPDLDRLAERAQWVDYARLLARQGCGWWFRMDIPRLEHHLSRFLAHQSAGLSPRLRLFEGIITPLPGAEKLPSILSTLGALHRVLLLKRDVEGAAACAGLALAAVWDFGVDFGLARPWLDRVDRHLARADLPAIARAHLLAFSALFDLFLGGDVPSALGRLDRQARAAVEADCPELTVYGGCVCALAHLFGGDGVRAEVTLDDAELFVPRLSPTSHARVYHALVRGVVLNGLGRPEEALPVLDRAAELLPAEQMPLSMRVQLTGYRLMAAALLRDEGGVARYEAEVRRLAVADRNHLHAAFMHFSLGAAHLRRGRPYRALVHAQRGADLGDLAHSPIPTLLNEVLEGQAFGDLNEADEADAALGRVERLGGALPFFLRAAAVERAHRFVDRGKVEAARTALEQAGFVDGVGSGAMSPFRSPRFNARLHQRLLPAGGVWAWDADLPIRVETLGGFTLFVGGRPLYDRRWKSNRSQRLLKLLVALGGTRVPVQALADELWPDASGDHAYASFKTALARLRKVAGEGPERVSWLPLRSGRVSLSKALVEVDALAFRDGLRRERHAPDPQRLLERLESYTGPFLPLDNHSGILARFRREVERLYVEGVHRVVDAARTEGLTVDLPELLGRAVERAPGDESLHVLRVRSLLEVGDWLGARRAYRNAVAAVHDLAGLPPGGALARWADAVGSALQKE